MSRSREYIEWSSRASAKEISVGEETSVVRVLGEFDVHIYNDDESVGPCLRRDGFWESWITSWFTKNVHQGMTVLDIGANTGYYSLLAKSLVGDTGHVVAYEANPKYVDLLKSTVASNPSYPFDIRPYAVGYSNSRVTLSIPETLHGSASTMTNFENGMHKGHNISVEGTFLDEEFYRAMAFREFDVIKIDAEGAEEMIFAGGSQMLHDVDNCTILLEWTANCYSEYFYDALVQWGEVSLVNVNGDQQPTSKEEVLAASDWITLAIVKK